MVITRALIYRYKKSPRIAIQKQENLTVVFKFMKEDEKIELVNIGELMSTALGHCQLCTIHI